MASLRAQPHVSIAYVNISLKDPVLTSPNATSRPSGLIAIHCPVLIRSFDAPSLESGRACASRIEELRVEADPTLLLKSLPNPDNAEFIAGPLAPIEDRARGVTLGLLALSNGG